MSFRLARLLSVALIGTCVTTVAIAAGPTLVWRGDVTTARGVVTDVAKAWEKSGKGKIELQSFNTASGLEAVASGTADLAGSARGSAGGAESNLEFTPVAWDALVVITYPSNPVNSLTLSQLHDIYYGKITNWKDVGGKDELINVYAVASPGDGVEHSLRRLLFGRGNQPVAAPRLYVNTAKLEEAVTLDPKSLGATTLAGVHNNRKVKILKIDDVAPSSGTIASGAYSLFTPLYLITNANSPKAAEIKAFVDFVSSDAAKSVLRSHQLIPYADGASLVAMDSSRRAKILAEVGARPSAGNETPLSAPGATLAARAAVAPTSALTQQAKQAVEARNAKKEEPQLAGVTGSVEANTPPSLKGVHGEAMTVSNASAHGVDFAKVTSDVFVSYDKPLKNKPSHSPKESTSKPAKDSGKVTATTSKPSAASKTYTVGSGETLYSIAKKHSVDVAQLRNWNHIKDNTVHQGQVLRVSSR
ncbi:substrate-binding domain-containing protein [Dyella tabacisoli]|uniref:LysM peptidoglycan-binding domain-containing protein n=1 Tax=Dyella tabacisoli TaxID=2282381 RepID=A0A369UQK0_9GAMM|nr:substrate-binding domain-containing protein [Dyella tabacisoli]RDD82737.1 LysM peptidoglycan-binding domain-containing protein [Dyella tabacisoli]